MNMNTDTPETDAKQKLNGIRGDELKTPETDAAWEKLCCSGQSWYQIAERLKQDCRVMERARNQLADEVAFAWKSKAKDDDYIQELKSRMNDQTP